MRGLWRNRRGKTSGLVGKKQSGSQFLRSQEPGQQAPNSKFQAPKKNQAPSSKTDRDRPWPPQLFSGFEILNFSGAWGLLLGVSLSGAKIFT
jgi:hypothetical protein